MNDSDREKPSKTQLKREVEALQALGEALIELPDTELAAIPVPETLLEAIRDARRMNKRGALYRQKQYIGRLMREIDAEPISNYMAHRHERARRAAARFHDVERWRDRLIDAGDAALQEFLPQYPDADRQHLRRLMRDAKAERQRELPARSARELFRYLDRLME